MRKLLFLIPAFLTVACTQNMYYRAKPWPVWTADGTTCINVSDSTIKLVFLDDTFYVHPGDSFPGEHPWNFPDSLKVALVMDGQETKDSVWAQVWCVPRDSLDTAYVYRNYEYDGWFYNLKGKFLKYVDAEPDFK